MQGELRASYKLVEKPSNDKPVASAEQQKAARAQAAVQGITPAQPAPAPAPVKVEEVRVPQQDKPSFLGRFFGWFKSFGGAEAPEAKPVAAPAKPVAESKREPREGGKRRERPENKGERTERGEQKADKGERRERNEARPAKADKVEKTDKSEGVTKSANAEVREPREAREPRPPKPPREPRPPRVSEDKAGSDKPLPVENDAPVVVHVALENVAIDEEVAPREGGRRRGRRGGRRERERRENQAAEQGTLEMERTDAPIVVQVSAGKRGPSEYVALPQRLRDAAAQAAALSASAPVVEVAPVAQVEHVEASVAVETQPVEASVADDGSLIQVETDPAKLVSPEMLAMAARPGASRRRARPREVYVENEPLVQVETRH